MALVALDPLLCDLVAWSRLISCCASVTALFATGPPWGPITCANDTGESKETSEELVVDWTWRKLEGVAAANTPAADANCAS